MAAMPYNIENTRKILEEMNNPHRNVRIFVGGSAFIRYPELHDVIDAAYAHGREDALQLAQRCCEEIRV